MANLNPEKLKADLAKIAERVLLAEREAVQTAMFEMRAEFIDRIFQKGEDNENSKIGNYSTKPIYVSPASLSSQIGKSGLQPKGKSAKKGQRNQGQFKNGKPRKSQYFPGGYKEFRNQVGRQSDTVDLFLSGSLRGSIQVGTRQENPTLEFLTEEQLKKAQGNEARFNKTIFAVTESEADIIVNRWADDVAEAFLSSFQ